MRMKGIMTKKNTLVFDTETTGFAQFRLPAAHESQPHLVQLGAILYDADWKVRAEINLIVKPDGWTIPTVCSDIHGITQEIAEMCGVPRWQALSQFDSLVKLADIFVAHNFSFDDLVMNANHIRETNCFGTWSHIKGMAYCTMQAMTPICKLPGTRAGTWPSQHPDYKWPKLQEAFKHAFGKEFEGAHDAMADVRACADIYRWLQSQNI
jgi:DNA polymerase-3 subunit epsilon